MKNFFTVLFVSLYAIKLAGCANEPEKQQSTIIQTNHVMKMQAKVSGKGRPLLLVPGGLTGWQSWQNHANLLSDSNMVISVQLLNVQFGLEGRDLPAGYSVKMESEALAASLDSMGFAEPLDIVGWSYGGFTALQFALDHPESVRTLTLIEPPAMWVLRVDDKLDMSVQKEANFFTSLKNDITEDMLAEFLEHAGFVQAAESARELPQWNSFLPFRQSLRNSSSVVDYRDDIKRLQEFSRPVLLVKGTGSAQWLHQIVDVLSANFPDVRVVEFPGGHAPHLASPEQFFAELERLRMREDE